jgi:hypothetical protein
MTFGLSNSQFLKARVFEPERVLAAVRKSLAAEGHLRTVFFWGVAFRQTADVLDRCVMTHLTMLMANLGAEFKTGTRLTLLLGDTHARANRIPEATIASYCRSVTRMAHEFQIQTESLSQIAHSDLSDGPMAPEHEMFAAHQHQLLSDATKLGFGPDAASAALRYFLVRWRERAPIARKVAPSILLAADRPSQAFLLPDLPTLFIYTLPGRKVCKPWLIKNDIQERTETTVDLTTNERGPGTSVRTMK